MKQGDPLSSKPFSSSRRDGVPQNELGRGFSVNGEWYNHLRFANDLFLIANSARELDDARAVSL